MSTSGNNRKRGAPSPGSIQQGPRQGFSSGHDRKRLKIQDARTIVVQSTESALKSGQLDISTYVRAREFEIQALENAIRSSQRSNSKRAFQMVPRSMRRRTASHNVKRVPKRLRLRAAKEMQDDNTPTVTSRRRKPTPRMRLRLETAKKLRRISQGLASKAARSSSHVVDEASVEDILHAPKIPRSKFRKRQKDKTWLPTHVWHAKRAHMTTRWRYAIAESPNEKSYRPTHRASTLRGAVAWDCSYFDTILIKGVQSELVAALKHILDPLEQPAVIGKGLIRLGKRHWCGWMYENDGYPLKPIAPVQLLWRVPEAQSPNVYEGSKPQRQILLRVHPSAFLQLWKTLVIVKNAYPTVKIEDLRFELGSIVVRGPASTAALIAVLNPTDEAPEMDSPEGIWSQLQQLTNTSTLPPGTMLAYRSKDTRIQNPPRKRPISDVPDHNIPNILSKWQVDRTQGPSDLFLKELRKASITAKPSQKRINKRKAELAPGELPPPLSSDPKIPVVLLANRYNEPNVSEKQGLSHLSKNTIGGWTVILPWRWIQPIWYCLMHIPGVRFGGLEEFAQIEYEVNAGSYPADFPGTKSGMEEEERKASERKTKWDKRPRAKRIAWESVDIGEGRKGELGRGETCDWEWLVQNVRKEIEIKATSAKNYSSSSSAMDLDESSIFPNAQPPPSASSEEQPSMSTEEAALLKALHPTGAPWLMPFHIINRILACRSNSLPRELASIPQKSLASSLFSVSIHVLYRGHPTACARIYRLPRDPANPIRKAWLALLKSHELYRHADVGDGPRYNKNPRRQVRVKQMQDSGASKRPRTVPPPKPLQPGKEEYPVVPGDDDLIGFVITGGYNLKEGKGTGVGALAFGRVVGQWDKDEGEQNFRGSNDASIGRLCIVREAGSGVGRLARWYLRL